MVVLAVLLALTLDFDVLFSGHLLKRLLKDMLALLEAIADPLANLLVRVPSQCMIRSRRDVRKRKHA